MKLQLLDEESFWVWESSLILLLCRSNKLFLSFSQSSLHNHHQSDDFDDENDNDQDNNEDLMMISKSSDDLNDDLVDFTANF